MDNLCRKIAERKELISKLEKEIKLLEEATIKGIPSHKYEVGKKPKKKSPKDLYEVEKLINLLKLELDLINES